MASKVSPAVLEVCKKFLISDDQLCEISDRLLESMKEGLAKSTHPTAAVKCLPTYVQDFPTGKELGDFMALDLGGTNFRVLKITLGPGNKFNMVKEKYAFPDELKVGVGEKLFDYIAECVDDFCQKHNLKSGSKVLLPMGFTFSFPVSQVSLNKGFLIKWTKGFNASGVVGNDVVALLVEAFHRKQLNDVLTPVALLNDTTGTLMSCAWEYPDTRIGLIVGTGCNACYAERTENVETAEEYDANKPFMVLNMEWGNFGADGKIDDFRTEFDWAVDKDSIHPKHAIFEKCISGMYLGEIMRRVLVKLIENKAIFGGNGSKKMSTPDTFDAEFITKIERDAPGTYENGKATLAAMDIKNPSDQDLIDLRYISECISGRSAAFVSAGIATLINRMGINPVTVGVDGTVYRQHPKYKSIMEEKIRCLIRPELNFKLVLSEDGSGRGAAFVAAVLQEQVQKKK